MTIPCKPTLKFQSAWMRCSAPEMTTVSKPKRNPASAETSDQKKICFFTQLVKWTRTSISNGKIFERFVFISLGLSARHRTLDFQQGCLNSVPQTQHLRPFMNNTDAIRVFLTMFLSYLPTFI